MAMGVKNWKCCKMQIDNDFLWIIHYLTIELPQNVQNFTVKPLARGSTFFHLSYEYVDIITMADKSIHLGKLLWNSSIYFVTYWHTLEKTISPLK